MHQPAWLLWDTIKLAGIEPTLRGYTIDPLLPMRDFSLRLPNVGLTWRADAGRRATSGPCAATGCAWSCARRRPGAIARSSAAATCARSAARTA